MTERDVAGATAPGLRRLGIEFVRCGTGSGVTLAARTSKP